MVVITSTVSFADGAKKTQLRQRRAALTRIRNIKFSRGQAKASFSTGINSRDRSIRHIAVEVEILRLEVDGVAADPTPSARVQVPGADVVAVRPVPAVA